MVMSGSGLILAVRAYIYIIGATEGTGTKFTGIDKSSSAELQEALDSMWRYYAQSNICYVFMVDIPDACAG